MELTGEDTGNGTHVARGGPRVLAGVVGAHHPLLRHVEFEQFEVWVALVHRGAAAGPTAGTQHAYQWERDGLEFGC